MNLQLGDLGVGKGLAYGAACLTPAHRGKSGLLKDSRDMEEQTAQLNAPLEGNLNSPFSADWAGPPIGVKVLLQAPLAEPVPTVARATSVPQELRADRAEQLGIGLGLKDHWGCSRVWK